MNEEDFSIVEEFFTMWTRTTYKTRWNSYFAVFSQSHPQLVCYRRNSSIQFSIQRSVTVCVYGSTWHFVIMQTEWICCDNRILSGTNLIKWIRLQMSLNAERPCNKEYEIWNTKKSNKVFFYILPNIWFVSFFFYCASLRNSVASNSCHKFLKNSHTQFWL